MTILVPARSIKGRLACVLLLVCCCSAWCAGGGRSTRALLSAETTPNRDRAPTRGLQPGNAMLGGIQTVSHDEERPINGRPIHADHSEPALQTGNSTRIRQIRGLRSSSSEDPFLEETEPQEKRPGLRQLFGQADPEPTSGTRGAAKETVQPAAPEKDIGSRKKLIRWPPEQPDPPRVRSEEGPSDHGIFSRFSFGHSTGHSSSKPEVPQAAPQETPREKVDGLMERAHSAVRRKRINEALVYAIAAERIERSAELRFRPNEERPSAMVARLRDAAREQQAMAADRRREEGRPERRTATPVSRSNLIARAQPTPARPDGNRSAVEFLPPAPVARPAVKSPPVAVAKAVRRTETSTPVSAAQGNVAAPRTAPVAQPVAASSPPPARTAELSTAYGNAESADSRVARVSANQGRIEIRPALTVAQENSGTPATTPVYQTANLDAAASSATAAPVAAQPSTAQIAMRVTPAPVNPSATTPVAAPRGGTAPASTSALEMGTAFQAQPGLPAPPAAAPATAAVPATRPSAPPVSTVQPGPVLPTIPPTVQAPAAAVVATPAPANPAPANPAPANPAPANPAPANSAPATAAVSGPAFSVTPIQEVPVPIEAAPVPGPIAGSDAAAPAPRVKAVSDADRISTASLIGFIVGIVGLCGLGLWRRLENQHYRPQPQ